MDLSCRIFCKQEGNGGHKSSLMEGDNIQQKVITTQKRWPLFKKAYHHPWRVEPFKTAKQKITFWNPAMLKMLVLRIGSHIDNIIIL